MMFSQFIARRYLFSKKSTNAINLITGISVAGIAIGMAALILELAVFNGFEDLLSSLFNRFNPDIKITAREGKFFQEDSLTKVKIKQIDGVDLVAESLEEIALFDHDGNIAFATIKGVDSNYVQVTGIQETIISGSFNTKSARQPGAVLGNNIKNKLGISFQNPFTDLRIYVPRTKRRTLLDQPFKSMSVVPTGSFSFQQEYDNQYVFSHINFVQGLIDKPGMLSAYEVLLDEGADLEKVKKELSSVLGEDYEIKDRYQQDEAFFKLMKLEKWMFYALFVLTLILIAFNMIGALWMIVLDKKQDISVLKALGASDQTVERIFLGEGILISNIGILIGSVLAIGLYWYHTQYGLISIPEGFIVDRYPMVLKWMDFVIAAVTMLCIGLLASFMPARRARRITSVIRAE